MSQRVFHSYSPANRAGGDRPCQKKCLLIIAALDNVFGQASGESDLNAIWIPAFGGLHPPYIRLCGLRGLWARLRHWDG